MAAIFIDDYADLPTGCYQSLTVKCLFFSTRIGCNDYFETQQPQQPTPTMMVNQTMFVTFDTTTTNSGNSKQHQNHYENENHYTNNNSNNGDDGEDGTDSFCLVKFKSLTALRAHATATPELPPHNNPSSRIT